MNAISGWIKRSDLKLTAGCVSKTDGKKNCINIARNELLFVVQFVSSRFKETHIYYCSMQTNLCYLSRGSRKQEKLWLDLPLRALRAYLQIGIAYIKFHSAYISFAAHWKSLPRYMGLTISAWYCANPILSSNA
jgi:hypothetical protein